MQKRTKKGFTMIELVLVIAVVAVLAAVLIPTFTSLVEKANESAYLQDRQNDIKQDQGDKITDPKYMTWEDFEAALAEIILNGSENFTDVLEKYSGNSLTAEQMQAIIDKTLAGQLTTAQVEAIVRNALNGKEVDEATIERIVNDAIAALDKNIGITPEEMAAAISAAIADAETANKENIEEIINTTLENYKTANETYIQSIIDAVLAKQNDSSNGNGGQSDVISEIQNTLTTGGSVKLSSDLTISTPINIQAGINSTLDLNGHTLTLSEQSQLWVEGALSIKNGRIISKAAGENEDGYVRGINIRSGGTLYVSDVEEFTIAENGENDIYGIYNGGIVSIDNSHFTMDESISDQADVLLLYNGGTAFATNSSFTANVLTSGYKAPIENSETLDMTSVDITSSRFCTINSGTILIDNRTGGTLTYGDGATRNCYCYSSLWGEYGPDDETGYSYYGSDYTGEVTHYVLLNDQIEALSKGGTVTLTSDGFLTAAVTLSANATLDLGGHTLTMIENGSLNVSSDVTIQNGTIAVETDAFSADADTAITVNSGAAAIIDGCTIDYGDSNPWTWPCLLDNQGTLTVNNSTIDAMPNSVDASQMGENSAYTGSITDVQFDSDNFKPFISTGVLSLTEVQVEAYNCDIHVVSADETKITLKKTGIETVTEALTIAEGKTVTIVLHFSNGINYLIMQNTITVSGTLNIVGPTDNPVDANIDVTSGVKAFIVDGGTINFTNSCLKANSVYIAIENKDNSGTITLNNFEAYNNYLEEEVGSYISGNYTKVS